MHMPGQKSQREGEFDLCTERGKRPESFKKFRHSFVVHEFLRDIFLQVLFVGNSKRELQPNGATLSRRLFEIPRSERDRTSFLHAKCNHS
jgi:hypothetical protein